MNEKSRLLKGLIQRKKRFFAILKIVLVFYLMIFSIKYVTSTTSAYFYSKGEATVSLTAGTWADNSRLEFTDRGNLNIQGCPATMVVNIKNMSNSDMNSPSKFEIYYVDKDKDGGKDKGGNPKIHGTKTDIPEGQNVIPALKSGEQTKLSFETNQDTGEGFYNFYAYQTNKSIDNDWSVKVKVKCKSNNGKTINEQNDAPKEELPKESVENEKTDTPETKPSEETGSDGNTNQTPENNEQTSTDENSENPLPNQGNNNNKSKDAVNNSVPNEITNVEGNKENDGQ
ncbi:amyloid fiber anchoring/assembly protein TapA [Bacillus sp. JJ1562]|uniref:amyloid fiber anchoring/assembly protein TapA n=1 Tax=Bacillus sp. JJ1562 TaxID=3122960 RepID=UPI003001FE6E